MAQSARQTTPQPDVFEDQSLALPSEGLSIKKRTMRPSLHFVPASGWMNDPHGITARNGNYDVFFQHVPDQTIWAPHCHWGHATGPDMLSLEEKPIAIAPGDGDDGIWTGCIATDGSEARAFYTAISTPDFGIGRIRVADPDDASWQDWSKGDVVVEAPPELDLIAFRDPFVRRDGDHWRMFVGAAGRDGTAMALTYASRDLASWTYDGVALSRSTTEREPVWMGALWECPQIFDLDGSSVMLSSIWDADVLHYAAYALGSLADGRFEAEGWGRLTWGSSYYAPSLFTDVLGRACVTFWLRGVGGEGWQGAQSLPHILSVADGRLVARPHPDVLAHRTRESLDGCVVGLAVDIEWASTRGALNISSGGQAVAVISRRGSSVVVTTPASVEELPADGTIRVVLDGPILEVSTNIGLYASVIEPEGANLEVSATSGELKVFGLA